MTLFIGLMSGTSLDGVDGVLVDLALRRPKVLAHVHQGFDAAIRADLLRLNGAAEDELHRAALAANAVSRAYAACVSGLLAASGHFASNVAAIGAHGQTVRHRPQSFDGTGYTLQLLNGALLAELTGIDVICDFRSRDIAAGGQGAPLVPAFHAALFTGAGAARAVLNVGGIANLTLLGVGAEQVGGFDCGPGNALMDGWCERHTGQPFDGEGRWAASGSVVPELLDRLESEPFFAAAPPKSTGRDLFHLRWLDEHLAVLSQKGLRPRAQDVQATLAELTVRAAAAALREHAPATQGLLVCGGGAFNLHLMNRLASILPGVDVASTAREGVPPDQVEALAFAWMARAWLRREPANVPAVTGALGPRVLGACYPAR